MGESSGERDDESEEYQHDSRDGDAQDDSAELGDSMEAPEELKELDQDKEQEQEQEEQHVFVLQRDPVSNKLGIAYKDDSWGDNALTLTKLKTDNAQTCGLKEGDRICAIDDQEITCVQDIKTAIADKSKLRFEIRIARSVGAGQSDSEAQAADPKPKTDSASANASYAEGDRLSVPWESEDQPGEVEKWYKVTVVGVPPETKTGKIRVHYDEDSTEEDIDPTTVGSVGVRPLDEPRRTVRDRSDSTRSNPEAEDPVSQSATKEPDAAVASEPEKSDEPSDPQQTTNPSYKANRPPPVDTNGTDINGEDHDTPSSTISLPATDDRDSLPVGTPVKLAGMRKKYDHFNGQTGTITGRREMTSRRDGSVKPAFDVTTTDGEKITVRRGFLREQQSPSKRSLAPPNDTPSSPDSDDEPLDQLTQRLAKASSSSTPNATPKGSKSKPKRKSKDKKSKRRKKKRRKDKRRERSNSADEDSEASAVHDMESPAAAKTSPSSATETDTTTSEQEPPTTEGKSNRDASTKQDAGKGADKLGEALMSSRQGRAVTRRTVDHTADASPDSMTPAQLKQSIQRDGGGARLTTSPSERRARFQQGLTGGHTWPPSEAALPKGWKMMHSRTNGKPYYYNTATKETSSARPASESLQNLALTELKQDLAEKDRRIRQLELTIKGKDIDYKEQLKKKDADYQLLVEHSVSTNAEVTGLKQKADTAIATESTKVASLEQQLKEWMGTQARLENMNKDLTALVKQATTTAETEVAKVTRLESQLQAALAAQKSLEEAKRASDERARTASVEAKQAIRRQRELNEELHRLREARRSHSRDRGREQARDRGRDWRDDRGKGKGGGKGGRY